MDYVARWRFDEGTGSVAADASTNGNSLSLTGGAAWGAGHSSYGLSLDGINDQASRNDLNLVGAFPAGGSDPAQDFTLSAWIKLDRTGTNQTILAKQGNSKARGFVFYVGADNKLSLQVFNNAGDSTTGTSIGGLSSGAWHHVAVSYDYIGNNTSVMRFYIDGVLDATVSNSVGPVRSNTQAIKAGAYPTSNWYLDGIIDELRVYARMLAPEEIIALAR